MSGLEVGSTLGGYKILARLRAGAMGVLYLARRLGPAGFARPVAIKVIHDHLAQNKRFCRMFIAEAKLSARIDDPHVVRVEEFGEADGRYYLVMEFVHGVSLAQALGVLRKRGGLPLDVSVAIAMDIASGLHAAHEATDEEGQPLGIVHRDVSPHNVLVSYKGYVKVIDFGIAKAKEGAGQTLTGSIRGKLAYMPPEQARSAKHVDRRADVYALGLVIWEMLVGRRMFDGTNDIALLNQIKNPVIVPPSGVNARVPKELDDVVLKLLEKDPEDRPPAGATVARMLATAFPAATKVLAADIAAVMNEVRIAATEQNDDEDEASGLYGAEVRKGLTIFGRSMHESVEAADGVLENLESSPDVSKAGEESSEPKVVVEQDKTAVMKGAPVRRPKQKDTIKVGPPLVMIDESGDSQNASQGAFVEEDETTLRKTPPHAQPIPRSLLNQQKTMLDANNPYLNQPASPENATGLGSFMPAWVTPPVMVLAPLTLALAVALIIVQCGSRSDDPRAVRTTQGAVPSATATASSWSPPSSIDSSPMPNPLAAPTTPPVLAVAPSSAAAPASADPPSGPTAPSPGVIAPTSKPAPTARPTSRPGEGRPAIERAREAALDGKPSEVRGLLEVKVRSGHGSLEEARLLRAACKQMGDSGCADDVAQKYPLH